MTKLRYVCRCGIKTFAVRELSEERAFNLARFAKVSAAYRCTQCKTSGDGWRLLSPPCSTRDPERLLLS